MPSHLETMTIIEEYHDDLLRSLKKYCNYLDDIQNDDEYINMKKKYVLIDDLKDFEDLLWFRKGSPRGEGFISAVKNQTSNIISILEDDEDFEDVEYLYENVNILQSKIEESLQWFAKWNSRYR